VPGNSRIKYTKEDGLQLPKYTEVKEIKGSGKISGRNIKLPEGSIMNGGTLSYGDGQMFVKAGDEVIIDKTKFLKTNNDVYFYSDKSFVPDEHQQENYYYERDKEIRIHSTEEGKVDVEFLAGNDFFNMYKSNSPDEKDFLSITSSEGSSVIIHNRADEGLIPKLEHIPTGKTTIKNGRLLFELDENEFYWMQKETVSMETVLNNPEGKYESVPLVISSSVLEDESRTPTKLLSPEIAVSSGNTIGIFLKDDPRVSPDKPRISFGMG
ncbi:unnamed protein product, partial [marine sediment metagenome]